MNTKNGKRKYGIIAAILIVAVIIFLIVALGGSGAQDQGSTGEDVFKLIGSRTEGIKDIPFNRFTIKGDVEAEELEGEDMADPGEDPEKETSSGPETKDGNTAPSSSSSSSSSHNHSYGVWTESQDGLSRTRRCSCGSAQTQTRTKTWIVDRAAWTETVVHEYMATGSHVGVAYARNGVIVYVEYFPDESGLAIARAKCEDYDTYGYDTFSWGWEDYTYPATYEETVTHPEEGHWEHGPWR